MPKPTTCAGMLLILLICWQSTAQAQQKTTTDTTKAKKPIYLTFQLDFDLGDFNIHEYDFYEGEYYEQYTQKYRWISRTLDTNYRLGRSFKVYHLAANVQFIKHLNIGLSYSAILMSPPIDTGLYSKNFFTIAGKVEYEYPISKLGGLAPFGSISLGSYQSNAYYENKGHEFYGGMKLGIKYLYKNKVGLRLYAADDYLHYGYHTFNERFGKTRRERVFFNTIYYGFGLCYRFTIVPN